MTRSPSLIEIFVDLFYFEFVPNLSISVLSSCLVAFRTWKKTMTTPEIRYCVLVGIDGKLDNVVMS